MSGTSFSNAAADVCPLGGVNGWSKIFLRDSWLRLHFDGVSERQSLNLVLFALRGKHLLLRKTRSSLTTALLNQIILNYWNCGFDECY